jgi:hypothetical protein
MEANQHEQEETELTENVFHPHFTVPPLFPLFPPVQPVPSGGRAPWQTAPVS